MTTVKSCLNEPMLYCKNDNFWFEAEDKYLGSPADMSLSRLLSAIFLGPKFQNLSFDKNMLLRPTGTVVSPLTSEFHDQSIKFQDAWLTPPTNDDDPADLLFKNIEASIQNSDIATRYVVRFSGGLDSMGILLSLLSMVAPSKILAVTYRSLNSSCNEDIENASLMCRELKIPHMILDLLPTHIFREIEINALPILSSRYASISFYEYERRRIENVTGGNHIVFDGHGGDHVFGERIPVRVISQLLKELRPLEAIRTAKNMARMEGLNLFTTMNRKRLEQNAFDASVKRYLLEPSLLPKIEIPCSLYQERIDHLEEAVAQVAVSSVVDRYTNVHFPFVGKSMIRYGANLCIERSFDSQVRRKQYRDAIEKKWSYPIKRIQKGHVTGAYQVALRERKLQIKSLIEQGYLARRKILNTSALLTDVEASSRGVGGLNSFVMRIITAELLLKKLGQS
ncbi:asparagine synthetase B (glutamine-hydrolyzing) [Pseudomonas sp. BIGb0408]|uniref:Asparagine synthetase B (Glutamine-hydrolyzing) n=1 Tax=Phytopseudomonas flavescens TaxID=29435 RepID=A0A7Z0BQD3_9GAMM|nr:MULTISPECIES: hypothetical protein [Pseudomonas]MCW2292386.1 asparagine synthetase B (glutamine-hydrolyzing) [Pseudomonas sp. BIGb0408]NYH73043.1 asparagine synthetase B (glutamine-hydrolyzing) [Pseudomonas flavescens]